MLSSLFIRPGTTRVKLREGVVIVLPLLAFSTLLAGQTCLARLYYKLCISLWKMKFIFASRLYFESIANVTVFCLQNFEFGVTLG